MDKCSNPSPGGAVEPPPRPMTSFSPALMAMGSDPSALIKLEVFDPDKPDGSDEDDIDSVAQSSVNASTFSFKQRKELMLLEIEKVKLNREIEIRKLEVEAMRFQLIGEGKLEDSAKGLTGSVRKGLDVANNIKLIPKFSETDVDTFFSLFERLAGVMKWPDSEQTLMLQCVLTGKAQKAYSSLSVLDSQNYHKVKEAVLKAYELVPEAYRQKFRNMRKPAEQTYCEFVRDLKIQLDRWCIASGVTSREDLLELFLLEQFKSTLSEHVSIFLTDRNVTSAEEAAILTDEYALTHKCEVRKSRSKYNDSPTEHVTVRHTPADNKDLEKPVVLCSVGDEGYAPFITEGFVSLLGSTEKWRSFSDLGNNLAGDRVWRDVPPPPVVATCPVPSGDTDISQQYPEVFVSCALTRARRKQSADANLSDVKDLLTTKRVVPGLLALPSIPCQDWVSAQEEDSSLNPLFDAALPPDEAESSVNGYFIENNGVLLRKWTSNTEGGLTEPIIQVVVPVSLRNSVLDSAHGGVSGHLGVNKTYQHLLQYFYWPRIKSDVRQYIKTCSTCQLTGKPNQTIKPVPLYPIPVMEQPFQHLLVDCVGPLPPSKSGSVYLLTVMCQSTRYPAAYPLRSITTRSVVKALSQFISIFGIPKVVQSDQGTNFTSNMFQEILRQLGIRHNKSSAYHAESQGALERFHQTLKSLLRAYCTELKGDWEEGLPWLLLATREVIQESLGFSPNQLVFGHCVRGPMAVLSENALPEEPPQSLIQYVQGFRRRLVLAGEWARQKLEKTQKKMKCWFDRKSEIRIFSAGDQVLALLPLPDSPFCAKFLGPYTVLRKVSDQNYIISTPERRKPTQLCHVNLLKPFYSRNAAPEVIPSPVGLATSSQIDTPSRTHLIEHDIDVGDVKPVRQRFYRVSFEKRQKLEAEVNYMLENNIAKPSFSDWASPCLLVGKPDGTQRFCTDYRRVNTLTKPDSYPLPRMEDCVDQVGSANYVSKFDLLKGYWQVPLTARAQEISSFITPFGLYSYTVMSFGLRNAPATFQRLMNRVTAGLEGCAVYLDDIVVYSDTWDQHLIRIRALFKRLSDAKLTVNLAKCEFARATVTYLGKVVGMGKVRPVRAKVMAIDKFPSPQTKRELMRFLGMAGYYRSFCPNFSSVVAPLTDLLQAKAKFVWTPKCEDAFENVKRLLTSSPVLTAPRLDKPFKLQVDASQIGAGAVLLQADENGIDRPPYALEIRHVKGVDNILADALRREIAGFETKSCVEFGEVAR
ncbi:thy-1 membrane glycoprotein [Pimephales promelas]|nr:thy-1 membrane glycoprotein [Pimephales promelas]